MKYKICEEYTQTWHYDEENPSKSSYKMKKVYVVYSKKSWLSSWEREKSEYDLEEAKKIANDLVEKNKLKNYSKTIWTME